MKDLEEVFMCFDGNNVLVTDKDINEVAAEFVGNPVIIEYQTYSSDEQIQKQIDLAKKVSLGLNPLIDGYFRASKTLSIETMVKIFNFPDEGKELKKHMCEKEGYTKEAILYCEINGRWKAGTMVEPKTDLEN